MTQAFALPVKPNFGKLREVLIIIYMLLYILIKGALTLVILMFWIGAIGLLLFFTGDLIMKII